MAEKNERFVTAYRQNAFGTETRILVDRDTGVNYLFFRIAGGGIGGGLTPLLDREGRPIVTAMPEDRNEED